MVDLGLVRLRNQNQALKSSELISANVFISVIVHPLTSQFITISQKMQERVSLFLRRFVFDMVEASTKRERLVMNRKGPWKGSSAVSPVVPFPPSFAHQF